jgi:hypothetical protein
MTPQSSLDRRARKSRRESTSFTWPAGADWMACFWAILFGMIFFVFGLALGAGINDE